MKFGNKNSKLLLVLGIIALWVCKPATGQENESVEIPIIEQKPFDLIQLDEVNNNVTIKILPLADPPSNPLPRNGVLVFESPELSDEKLQVPFQNVVRYRSYLQLIQAEADRHIRDKNYGQAFRNLIYVYDNGGKRSAKVRDDIQQLLFRDGVNNYLSGNYELALTIFQDIYDRDPNFEVPIISKRPIDLILDSHDKNIATKFADGSFYLVRAAIDDLELQFKDDSVAIVEKWEKRLLQRSDQMLNKAREIARSGDGKLAHLTARRANSVLPGRPEALQLFQEILNQYPITFVGVSDWTELGNPLDLAHWASRRVGRLTQRSVFEFQGPGDDGGSYTFSNGTFEQLDDDGFVFRFSIEPVDDRLATPGINAYQLSQQLIARGTVGHADYDVPFAKIVDTLEIKDESNIVIRLKKAFVRPEALFLFLYPDSDGPERMNGAYALTEKNEEVMVFELNPKYEPVSGAQHPKIIEWRFPSASRAVDALIAGEIDVVDRIPLSDLNRLQENANIKVGSYIVPTVHMLVPNSRNEFIADRTFRNGLKQGINRDLILRDIICGGQEISGCEVISGPFPIGTEENDQISYGYNISVTPQPFNDQLGMVLTRVVLETRVNYLIRTGAESPQVEFPAIVLAHGADEVAEVACFNIQQMWEAMGLQVVLRKLEPGQVEPDDDEWDFLYYQISMEEPLTNADLLFGRDGVVNSVSAPVEQNMQRLGFSDSWRVAGKTLRRLHRQVVNDVSVIPLWQLKEHFAYRDNLSGISRNPVHLYESVLNWRIESTATEDSN